jgi:hypothetical protein
MTSPFFNAHHSPVGAFATLTLGMKGPKGGFGLELDGPANENVYVGLEERQGGQYRTLPFHGGADVASQDFDVEGLSDLRYAGAVSPFDDSEISRTLGAGVDEWSAGDLTFRIYSPPRTIPEPGNSGAKEVLTPAIIVELTADNSEGKLERKAFFGYGGSNPYIGMRILDEPGLVGIGQGTSIAIASADPGIYAGLGWQPEAVLSPRLPENLGFMLGKMGLLVGTVAPGEKKTFRFAVAFYRDGAATAGLRTRYLYCRWFSRIEEVLHSALASADATIAKAKAFDSKLRSRLSPERAFMAAHAIRSYYGSTQLLEREDSSPLWVVHEGEYRMMNTFDLTVDQAYFELIMSPWTVRNVLDLFVERYSYQDGARFNGSDTVYPGGIAFTHDMGVANVFAVPGRSSYEQAGLTGCFSYMSSEELLNWVLTAAMYVSHTGDLSWAMSQKATFLACLTSLENRDNPDPSARNGVMALDGARCEGGAEITTYDSLDASLGQARNNLYLAVKSWASYLLLEDVLKRLGETEAAARCRTQAERAAKTVIEAADADGLLPAVIGEGVDARIIPAIEALAYPFVAGLPDDFPDLRAVLMRHFQGVLQPGICRFADGGWKLSSTSQNSWLSKIYLCQFVAERIFGLDPDAVADKAHVAWLLDEDNVYYAWSDQMVAGKAEGSRYYPRGVTSILWLSTGCKPIEETRALLHPDS